MIIKDLDPEGRTKGLGAQGVRFGSSGFHSVLYLGAVLGSRYLLCPVQGCRQF